MNSIAPAGSDPSGQGRYVWLDGRMLPSAKARLHVLSHGLHYALSVFEGVRAYDGHLFRLADHNRRLRASASAIGFEVRYDSDRLDAAACEVLAANSDHNAYLRPIAWRGGDTGFAATDGDLHVAIASWSWPRAFGGSDDCGISLAVSPWRRPRPDQAPLQAKASAHYLIGAMARRGAIALGCDDALMLDADGYVAEATGANLFMVDGDERLITPPAVACLNGITRQTVMTLAGHFGIEIVERRFDTTELMAAREVFLAGTAYEIQPVSRLAGARYPVGPVTNRFRTAYDNLVHSAGAEAERHLTLFLMRT